MHSSVMQWIDAAAPRLPGRVLELGSRDVNGSVRELFRHARAYIGIDMVAGRRVDVQALASWLPFPDSCFDTVVSTEMLEHDIAFWYTFEEAHRVLHPGGRLLITCRGLGFPHHSYPSDYYRFTPDALQQLARLYGFRVIHCARDPQFPGVFLHAQKPPRL